MRLDPARWKGPACRGVEPVATIGCGGSEARIELCASIPEAVAGADLILVCAVASSLPSILSELSGHLAPRAIVADLTSSTRDQVRSLYRDEDEDGGRYIDVAIMGAISMQGSRTPLLAAAGTPRTSHPR